MKNIPNFVTYMYKSRLIMKITLKILLLGSLLLLCGDIYSQKSSGKGKQTVISYNIPSFMGENGESFNEWVHSKLVYPEEAIKGNKQGVVVVRFNVDTLGAVNNVGLLKEADSLLNAEVIRVVSSSPDWIKPNPENGKPMGLVIFTPVIFSLSESDKKPVFEIPKVVEQGVVFLGGGWNGLEDYINSNLNFPKDKEDVSGYSIFDFMIDTSGKIIESKIAKGTDSVLDAAVVNIVSGTTEWNPARIKLVPRTITWLPETAYEVKLGVTCRIPVIFLLGKARIRIRPEIDVPPTFKKEDPYTRFIKYIQWNIRYPMKDVLIPLKKSSAIVEIGFVVSKDGTIKDAKIIKSSGQEPYDKAALKVVSKSPKWDPGMDKGEPVEVEHSVFIEFKNKFIFAYLM